MSPTDREILEKTFVAEAMAAFADNNMDTSDNSMNRVIAGIMAKAAVRTIERREALKAS